MKQSSMTLFTLFLLIIFGILFFLHPKENQTIPRKSATNSKTDVYRLKLGHTMHCCSALHSAAERFSNIVKYQSEGTVEIKVLGGKGWTDYQELIHAAMSGELTAINKSQGRSEIIIGLPTCAANRAFKCQYHNLCIRRRRSGMLHFTMRSLVLGETRSCQAFPSTIRLLMSLPTNPFSSLDFVHNTSVFNPRS